MIGLLAMNLPDAESTDVADSVGITVLDPLAVTEVEAEISEIE